MLQASLLEPSFDLAWVLRHATLLAAKSIEHEFFLALKLISRLPTLPFDQNWSRFSSDAPRITWDPTGKPNVLEPKGQTVQFHYQFELDGHDQTQPIPLVCHRLRSNLEHLRGLSIA